MGKTAAQLDREIDDKDLADFARGAFKHNATKRARLGYVVQGILRDRGIETRGLDDDALVALARAELTRGGDRSAHATKKITSPRGDITGEQARSMPRFEFIAHWLAVVTRKKENRDLAQGKRVKRVGNRWQIVSPVGGGTVEYETPDANRLFDYARRGPLGWHIRNAEEFRTLAHQETAR